MGVEFPGGERKAKRPVQDKILFMLTKEHLTPRQIAYRRRKSISSVYSIIRKLKARGVLKGSMGEAWKGVEVTARGGGLNGPYRLHAERWHILLSRRGTRYRRNRKQNKMVTIDTNRVLMHKDTIEVYSHMSFYGRDQQEAEERAGAYWRVFFKGLSERLRVAWERVRRNGAHYAYMGSELADEARARSERYCVRGKDGKVWLITDDSFKNLEHEAIHPLDAAKDMTTLDKHLNAFRDNPGCPTLPETVKVLHTFMEAVTAQKGAKELQETKDRLKPEGPRTKPDYFG